MALRAKVHDASPGSDDLALKSHFAAVNWIQALKGGGALKQRQEQFCTEFLRDFDPDAAARRAGYQGGGAGTRLLGRPEVRSRIGALRAAEAPDTQDAAPERRRVLHELSVLAYGGGEGKPSERLRALELLGRYLGLFAENAGGPDGAPVIIDDVRAAPAGDPAAEGAGAR